MLGKKLHAYRKGQGLTMKVLAERCGLSTGYISQLERGMLEPSLNSLRRLAEALDIPAYLLLDYPPGEIMTIRNADHMVMRNKEDTVLYEFLTPLPSERFMPSSVIIKFTIQPHSGDTEQPISHPSEEIITVLSGILTLGVCAETTVLNPGDSSVIRKNLPHIFRNEHSEPVCGISCITPPVWGKAMT
jgi:transcriptional regulator with XRE-family HTH domain